MNRASKTRIAEVVAVAALITAGCSNGNVGSGDWSAESLGRAAQDQQLTLVSPSSAETLAVGENRLALAVFDRDGAMVHDAESVTLRLFRLDGDAGELVQELPLNRSQLIDEDHRQQHERGHQHGISREDAALMVSADPIPAAPETVLSHDDELATLYAATVEFDRPEWWGLEVTLARRGQTHAGLRARIFVSEEGAGPALGEPVPASEQPVLRDVESLTAIDSAREPDPELHELTVKEAIATGQPVVIALATPRFCQTRYCGPVLAQAVLPIYQQYADQVQVLHIEPYDLAEADAGNLVPVSFMAEWELESEPWVFVLDREGRLAAKFEGVVTAEEIAAVLDPLLSQ